jgi:hypothetical protein
MKKFYVSIVVLFCIAGTASAQNYYWIGNANGNWTNTANWSNVQGGSPASDYPHASGDNVFFPANATVQLNISGTININRISVTGTNTNVVITGVGGGEKRIIVNSTNAAAPGISIASTCRLENSATGTTSFVVEFVADGQGAINGDWYFSGDIDVDNLAYFELPLSGASTALNVNNGGSITIGSKAMIFPNDVTGDDFLIFNSGASLNLLGNGGYAIVPAANYNAGSIINVTGITSASLAFEELDEVGTINYDCAAQSNGLNQVSLGLSALTVQGDVNILNTNDNELSLISYDVSRNLPSSDVTIEGDLNIQASSVVSVAHNDGPEIPNNLTVNGNVVANGTSLSIHTGSFVSTSPTKLIVKGDIQHTAGTFNASSAVTNETSDLFIIELAGNTNQNISSVTGSFDNTNHQVTLRMNNSAGATLLTSLQVGRIDFSSANKGVLSTGANVLTIANTTPVSVANIVVNSPSDLGYVNGNVQRRMSSTEPAVIPTGGGSKLRSVTVLPSSSTLSTFQAKFFNTGYSDLSVVSPLNGVSPDYYWNINRIGAGADASFQLAINGAIPGAQANDALIVAKYNGIDWANAKGNDGTMIVPGDASTGIVKSEPQTVFGNYTIGYALQSALPTLLVSFEGRKTTKQTNELKWEITSNSTPSTFEVMRSHDGISFTKIGSVAGIEGITKYQFSDNNILSGNNYYRLRMLDIDGTVTYSTILIISNGSTGIFLNSIAPTLVTGRTKLNIQSSSVANMQLVITDINGRIVHKQSVSLINGSQDVWLDASRFAAGIFQVSGYVIGEKTATLRFIKL